MKYIFILLSFVVFSVLPVFSQSIDATKELRNDDVLSKQQAAYESILEDDGSVIIANLNTIDVINHQYKVNHKKVGNDTVIGYENNSRTYYRQTANELLIVGYENRLSTVSYDMPELWLRFSMKLGDSICGYFHGKGDYCRQLFMRTMGRYKTVADGQGCLVLPDGDTLRHVLRLSTERLSTTIYRPMETVVASYGSTDHVPTFTVDSILLYLEQDTVPVRTLHHRWYAEGYRYPILETIAMMGKEETKPQLAVAFYYPPEEQLWLALDEENRIVRDRKSNEEGNEGDSLGKVNLKYNLIHHDSDHRIIMNYTLSTPISVKLLLCNVQGVVCQSIEQQGEPGQNCLSLNYGSLRRGQYLLYINAGQESHVEKIKIR